MPLNDYVYIKVDGKRMPEHTYVMEQHIGKKLEKGEVVHHHNKRKYDNRIKNLYLCKDRKEHALIHKKLKLHDHIAMVLKDIVNEKDERNKKQYINYIIICISRFTYWNYLR